MSRYRRSHTPGATYFFTVVTHRRRPLLVHDRVRGLLREGIVHARATLPFHIDALVLLPDHLHCIWTLPPGDADFGKRWGLIKRYVSRRVPPYLMLDVGESASIISRRESAFWQRRFWEHQIRDEEDFARHVDYIHANPWKHGLVSRVVEWPYSTFHRFVERGEYVPDWAGDADAEAGDFGE
jgi:putative transposase